MVTRVKLSVSGADQSVSNVYRPVSEETVQKESSCQMDEDGSRRQNILSSKLLDHPYCKSPLEAPLTGSGLTLENQVGGGKNSQKASAVDDEQLSICLSGMNYSFILPQPPAHTCCPFSFLGESFSLPHIGFPLSN